MCPLCEKKFKHPQSLKAHLGKHSANALSQAKVSMNQLVPMKRSRSIQELEILKETVNRNTVQIDETVWKAVCMVEKVAPVIKLIALEGARQSAHDFITFGNVHVHSDDSYYYKSFSYASFLGEPILVHDFNTEYQILKQAKEEDSSRILALKEVTLGPEFVTLVLPKFEMSLREYLQTARDYRFSQRILENLGKAITDLHKLGYVHRDLKPENIVINPPNNIRLIDFNRAFLTTVKTSGTARGTPPYFPVTSALSDGSKKWDAFAYGVIILEFMAERDEIFCLKRVSDV